MENTEVIRKDIYLPVYLPEPLYRLLRLIKHFGAEPAAVPQAEPAAWPKNLLGDRDVENSFVAANLPNGPGQALDFGNGGSPLSLFAVERGFSVVAIDLGPITWHYVHPSLRFVQGDILKLDLPGNFFDLVINCSTVEHVGISGRYNVTDNQADGDLEAMARLRFFMKPGAVMVMTVPVGSDAVFPPLSRIYGPARLPRLLKGFLIDKQEYWIKDELNRWQQCEREEALQAEAASGSASPLQNIYGLGCFVLRRPVEEPVRQ